MNSSRWRGTGIRDQGSVDSGQHSVSGIQCSLRRISLFAGFLLLSVNLFAGEVYQSVMQELTRHENRLPGSDAYYSSIDHLEKTLRAAGLEPRRQTYDTLVPDTLECRLAVDGVDLQPVYALGPNGPANNTIGGKVLKGPLVYLGKGTLAEMDGKQVEGCIAVLDFDSPYMIQVLSQGAIAVVFAGDGSETQWQVRSQFSEGPLEIPRLYVSRETADLHGLISGGSGRTAELSVTTVWKDVKGINLWVEIPGEPGAKFNFSEEEALVLSATIDTFGTIPEKSPSVRTAANCALLAETLVKIKSNPIKRSVFAVFFGSHYGMQDGARMFYFAVRRGKDGELEQRAKDYQEMLEASSDLVAILDHDDVFAQNSPLVKDIIVRVEKRLNSKVSTLNYELRQVRMKLLPYRRMQALLPADEQVMAELVAEESRIQSMRKSLNEMRRQFNKRVITDNELFAQIAGEEKDLIKKEVSDVQKLIAHNITHRELASRICPKRIILHLDIDLANSTGLWTLNMESIGAQMFYHSMNAKGAEVYLGDFVKNFVSIARMNDSLGGKGAPGAGLFAEPAVSLVFPGKFCTPSIRSTPVRVAHSIQILAYQLCTVGDPLDGDELPYRQVVDLELLVPRLNAFCTGLANDPEMSQASPLGAIKKHKDAVMHFKGEGGLRFLTFSRGSTTELGGVPEGGIAFCAPNNRDGYLPAIAGQSYSAASSMRASGHIFMPLLYNQVRFRPFGYGSDGTMQCFPRGSGWADPRLFYGQGGVFTLPLIPGGFQPLAGDLAGGKTDAILKPYQEKDLDWLAFFSDEEDPVKFFSKGGLLLLGATEEEPRGVGIPIDEIPLYSFNVLRQTAHDYLVLNNSRLQILRDKSIVNDSLESLHADAEDHWNQALSARERSEISTAVAHEAFSAGISSRVAPALREVTNDMVRAVILLLLLTLPFAFIMERLFISATSIYRQVIGFVAFFIASFALLYMVHPAFEIASSPLIIFLAFIIILLSSLVINIVMSKFKKELRAMQGLSTSAHGVASDSSTGMAAVLIGISGMRNRPLKTFLTGLTIVLLTFSIVVFASFSGVSGVTREYTGKGDGPSRIELHRFSGLEIPRMLYQSSKSMYSRDWHTFAREAFFRGPQSKGTGELLVVYREAGNKWQRLQGMMAFDPAELDHNAMLAAALPGLKEYSGEIPPLFLPSILSETMELSNGDKVLMSGKPFIFAGSFDAGALEQLSYLDQAKIMPPDFENSVDAMADGKGASSEQSDVSAEDLVDTTRFTYCSARSVGITLPGVLREFEGSALPSRMNAVMMYPKDGADIDAAATQIAKMFVGPVMAKGAGGVNKFFFTKSMQATGFSVVIVPLLLGGLIIFNSLLGSIVEREKEIFTYSAMGLAPPSVGALFFAESGVYAIMGGMGGFFVSQVVAKLMVLCGELGWFVPPEMNFSSLSSVMTSFVVMALVMVSTIYPALKAGRSANPGVARKWKMPAPADGLIDFVFPFTVSADDMGGILAFIREHFENHGDSSIGSFAASEIQLFRAGKSMGLKAHVSLAPFDLGVAQEFLMFSRPSEIEGIDEVVVRLKNISGTEGAWLRGNRVFVNDLREQFLFWRSLPVSTVIHYRAQSEQVASVVTDESSGKMEIRS